MKSSAVGRSTRAIHGRPHKAADRQPVSNPIFQSSTFANAIGSADEVAYTRYGNNPTVVEVSKKLAHLEGAESALLLASGMGATALAHLAVLRPGDHLLASNWIYGGTRALFTHELEKLGIGVTFIDPSHPRDWKASVQKNTRAVFAESPTNPLGRVVDLEPLGTFCRQRGIVLLVDATFATPINFLPLECGADVVIHSATKYLNGHSDVIAGVVAGNTDLVEEVRDLMKRWGQSIDPHAAWLVERGLKTLEVRMHRHNENGQAFAEWAEQHPKLTAVHYAGLPSHPDHELAKRLLRGFGGIVGLQVKGGAKAAESVLKRLRLATHAPSLGGVETLVSEPRLTSHAAMTAKERRDQGIPDGFIRVSLGIENIDDIIADFERGLSAL